MHANELVNSRMDNGITDYVLGIDTGGTYTDGVLLDYRSRKVLSSAKTLTTYDNLTQCVVKVVQDLEIEDPSRIKLVGISSTLATNSIAEGKARDVGLILIGYDEELIKSYGLNAKFSTDKYAFFQGGHNSQGVKQAELEEVEIERWVRENRDKFEALAISSYFSPLNPEHEERTLKVVQKIDESMPVVLGNQLSTKLDSIKRASTASLNASLVAVMHEFMEAVKKSLKNLGINAPLMIVKGDGSLMPYTEAAHKPVETVLSGPAASSIGGRFLSGENSALVVDIGGTTTDMALIEDGQVNVTDEGARVGDIETAVKAAHIRTACVGCDSRVAYIKNKELQIGPDRVIPLSRLAYLYADVEKEISNLIKIGTGTPDFSDLEFWCLSKAVDLQEFVDVSPRLADLIKILQKGPMCINTILKQIGVHHKAHLHAETLFQKGILEVATLTPSDILHTTGQMDLWSKDAAENAIEYAGKIVAKTRANIIEEVLEKMTSQIIEEAIIFLARQSNKLTIPETIDSKWSRWLLEQSIQGDDPYLSVNISSRFPLIGIGAPAHIFVKKAAEVMRSRFILPDNPHVANAVGAVAGSVIIDKEAIVYVQESEDKRAYMVRIEEETCSFMESDDAMLYAEKMAVKYAREGASKAGTQQPQIFVNKINEGGLQRVQVRAVGNPKLSEELG